MEQLTILEIILRIVGAIAVGFAIGAQRAQTSHPAGIRTHILVALGACVVMIISNVMYAETVEMYGTTPSDPARLGAQVINGIGFLGAGAILREGLNIKGLTTAATVWVVACLGLAVGMGYYFVTAFGTAAAFFTLVAFDGIQQRIRNKGCRDLDILLECEEVGLIVENLTKLARKHYAILENLSFSTTKHSTYEITFVAKFPANSHPTAASSFQSELIAMHGLIRMEQHDE